MINVPKEIIKNSGIYIIACLVAVPIILIVTDSIMTVANEGIDESMLPPEAKKQYDQVMAMSGAMPIIMIAVLVVMTMLRSDAGRIIRTANIEKRMERLKKLGADEFIKQTEAELIDVSPRGNYLYNTKKVISGRGLKFLMYKDISTDRKYISFVDDKFLKADDAMASKFSLSQVEYTMLKKENEA